MDRRSSVGTFELQYIVDDAMNAYTMNRVLVMKSMEIQDFERLRCLRERFLSIEISSRPISKIGAIFLTSLSDAVRHG